MPSTRSEALGGLVLGLNPKLTLIKVSYSILLPVTSLFKAVPKSCWLYHLSIFRFHSIGSTYILPLSFRLL